MGELIPTFDELKLLNAMRRHRNKGTRKVIIDLVSFTLEPVGKPERVKSLFSNRPPLDKKVVTA